MAKMILKDEFVNDGARVRRVFSLTTHCIANIAAYRAGWIEKDGGRKLKIERDFWVRINGNFLDIATLEWCKLFAERGGKHHWTKITKNTGEWRAHLLSEMHMTLAEYKRRMDKILIYRNKYLAHLDHLDHLGNPVKAEYPLTDMLFFSCACLYDALKTSDDAHVHLIGAYDSATDFYNRKYDEALTEMNSIVSANS